MHLIVGLGNPGGEYERTRHNLGFLVLDELARRLGLAFRGGTARYTLAVGDVAGTPTRVVLLKPLTYMNRSGGALREWAARERVRFAVDAPSVADAVGELDQANARPASPAVVQTATQAYRDAVNQAVTPIVVCDDISLPLGSLRVRARGSAGGHRGLESIIASLGGDTFPRVRLGVAGGDGQVPADRWSDYVLAPFPKDEWREAEALIRYAADALECMMSSGATAAASRYNRRLEPGAQGGG